MRLLVDTSVWIELLRRSKGTHKALADRLEDFVTCPPIIQEVLQGVQRGNQGDYFSSLFTAIPCVASPVPVERYLEAADIYRDGRAKGLTIRSSIDTLIAAIAIKENLLVWHRDRDFSAIARYTNLQQITKLDKQR